MHFSLSDMILDLFQNSVEAGSKRIIVDFIQDESSLKIKIEDDGKGMDLDTVNRIKDPFYSDGIKHKERRVGLGIPFLLQTTEMTDGAFDIHSEVGVGTKLNILFNLNHWDTPPVGSVVDLIISSLLFDGDYEFIFNREDRLRDLTYNIIRSDLIDVLGCLNSSTNMILLKEFIESQELDN